LEQVIEGRGFDNLTIVIMNVLKNHVGVFYANVVAKCFLGGVKQCHMSNPRYLYTPHLEGMNITWLIASI
jgi:hypothetical protein